MATSAVNPLFVASYYDDQAVRIESERALAGTWVNTGAAGRVPNPGDAIPLTVAGLPIVVVRGDDRELRAFHNGCRHRGARVLRAPCSGERLLRCHYHGWAYGLDGALRGAAQWKAADDSAPATFEPERFGLEAVRVAVWLDQVFINIDGNAPGFPQFVAPLLQRWQNYDLQRFVHGEQRTLEVDANWKFVVENYLDTYHLPSVHPQLGDMQAARRFTDVNVDDTVFGICYTSGAADKPKSSGNKLRRFERLSAAQQSAQDVLALYPNTLIEMQPTHMMLVAVEPSGPASCVERLNFYFIDDDATSPALLQERQLTADAWSEIMNQDLLVLRDLQAAAHSPAAARVSEMSPVWEQATFAFRHRLIAALGD